ncbi:hypothetical protein TRFO_34291 [Tritrichomonas foetus]|uniref:Vps16 N-terminal domain-containing protein n=1 Tax=Tritrichomonas foetus TaxID=1144522 RepID=A0A1J4JP74_9EUKA|nr:hypothetical protein TRFO_34291 [Tritrichomonas foetus]|eukprot:OHS99317.1 hypothetical protein TRFO_34291 [Tritrichomonas foetus]
MEKILGKEELSYSTVSDIQLDWTAIDDVRYSWKKIWDLDSILNFNPTIEKYSGGVNGSLIAQFEKSWNMIYAQPIRLYDYKGNLVYEYKIKSPASDLFFHVTSSDRLIVLTNKCQLFIFFAGRNVASYFLADCDVVEASIWDHGLVFLTANHEIYYAPFFENPTLLCSIAEFPMRPSVMKVIPAEYTANNSPIVYLNDCSDQITVATSEGAWQIPFHDQIITFAFSPNYSMIAFLCQNDDDLSLIITESDPGSSHLLTVILDTEGKTFLQLSWVGNDFPIITYEDSVNIVLSSGSVIQMSTDRYPFSGRSAIFTCSESALVFSSGSLFKIKIVNDDFSLVSSTKPLYPPSQLVDAFVKRSSDKAILLKKNGALEEAMDVCLKSALEVDSPAEQRILMLSANFARTYFDMSNKIDVFSENAQKLRLVNAMRNELNILLSPLHLFEEVHQNDILLRICNRQRFSLALKVADFLYYDKRAIITEWCLAMAYNISDDDVALRIISKKLDDNFEINAIATALHNEGRVELSKQVARLERSTARVVPFYISCGMWEEAIDAAVRSSDSSLFIDVVNQAIDNNLTDIVTDAVGRDFITYSTIAKMVGQQGIAQSSELSGKNEIYFRMCQKYASNYVPENMVTYMTRLDESNTSFDRKLQSFYNKRIENDTINKVIEKFILGAADPRQPKPIADFVSNMKVNKRKFYVMMGSTYAKHKKWNKFLGLTNEAYSSYWHHYVMMAQFHFGHDHATEFVNAIQDAKQLENLKGLLQMSPNEQYETFAGMKQVRLFDNKFELFK